MVGWQEGIRETQKTSSPELAASTRSISLGVWVATVHCRVYERTVETRKEHKQNADRTEKEIFGIFGIINTIKITNGKSQ